MKNIYLALAILGAIIPYVFFFRHFQSSGTSLSAFVEALFVNGAAAGFTADLLITSAAFWIWLAASKAKRVWVYILLNLLIGLSCALPAYLYVRERNRGEETATTAGG